jgi:hypothetical protein
MTLATQRPPTFCPSCGKGFPAADPRRLCDECGEGLVGRGYCPVCEGFVSAEIGTPCPKHDLPLEAGPEPLAYRADVKGPWVEVARFGDAVECHPPRIRLEAEGIPTTVEGELAGSKSIHAAFSGGVVLRVPESLAAEARVILSQKWSDDAKALGIEDDDDWDDVDEDFGDLDASEPSLKRTSPLFHGVSVFHAWSIVFWVVMILGGIASALLMR